MVAFIFVFHNFTKTFATLTFWLLSNVVVTYICNISHYGLASGTGFILIADKLNQFFSFIVYAFVF